MENTELLEAIGQMMDEKLAAQDKKMDEKLTVQKQEILGSVDEKFAEQDLRIMHNVSILFENEFQPQLTLLAEGQKAILDKLVAPSRVEAVESRVDICEVAIRQLSTDVKELKRTR